MFGLTLRQARTRFGRSLALLLGVLTATTGFIVLTGAVGTSRLVTTGTVNRDFRAAYDILVRPAGAAAPLERQEGLVRPNFLSGQFGGINQDQVGRIPRVSGVEVAAPVAMVGYVLTQSYAFADLTLGVDRTAVRQVLRATPTWSSDRGLTTIGGDAPVYAYVTRRPVAWPLRLPDGRWGFSDGREHTAAVAATCGADWVSTTPVEMQEDGSARPICTVWDAPQGGTGLAERERTFMMVARLQEDDSFSFGRHPQTGAELRETKLTVAVAWPMTLLLAAIDPAQEARLVGLDQAMVDGRYLRPEDGPVTDEHGVSIPVVATSQPYLDETMTLDVDRVDTAASGSAGEVLRQRLRSAPGVAVDRVRLSASEVYEQSATGQITGGGLNASLDVLVRSGHPTYEPASDGALRPVPADIDLSRVWSLPNVTAAPVPLFATDTAMRPLDRIPTRSTGANPVVGRAVGRYDPARLTEFSALSAVPLETYQPADANPGDARTAGLLKQQALLPNSNPGGYLATPPQLLTTLAALPAIFGPGAPETVAPISAVRVRVADVHGFDAVSRERVRRVAEQIAASTGLEVDITLGSSPTAVTVDLPAGRYGRPDLRLSEGWSRKGVVALIVRAVDRKSLVLFGLVLVVCALFVTNLVSAAVRDRRRELAVLACLGWPGRRLAMLVLAEAGLLGAAAGVLGAGVSLPLAGAAGVRVSASHALLAIPVALGLTLLSAASPAVLAARTHPGAALLPAVRPVRRTRRGHGVAGMAVAAVARVPGRAALAAAALAVGIAAVTVLAAVEWTFHGQILGTLLGDAVSVSARGVDIAAAVLTALLGAFAVADVLFLGVRERGAELAVLRAAGWSEVELTRLLGYEGLILGVLGAIPGAGIGLAAVAALTGSVPAGLLLTAGAAAAVGVLLGVAGAVVPALLLRRLPTAALLGED